MLRQVEARGDVNIFSYLKHIRAQRAHLVQTEEQYVFIHDALVEVIEAGETHINKTALPRYIHSDGGCWHGKNVIIIQGTLFVVFYLGH